MLSSKQCRLALAMLQQQPPAAQPAPPVALAGGLVERVAAAIAEITAATDDAPVKLWHPDARAAIREVAAWMRNHEHAFNAAY